MAKTQRVLALDLLGFGASDQPAIDYGIQTWVDFLGEFLRAKKVTGAFTVMGESLGGWIAAQSTIAAHQSWASSRPTLFDVVPVAALLDATLCPTVPQHITVTADGRAPETPGTPNALVGLKADKTRLVERAMKAWLR